MAATKKPKKVDTKGFVRGHGYHSRTTGNWYNFLGVDEEGRFHFYRRFSHDWQRLSKREALNLFTASQGKKDEDFGEDEEDELDINSYRSV